MTSLITTIRTSTINGNTGSTLTIGNNLTTNAIQIGTSTNSISIGATGCTTTIGATGSSTIIGGLLQTATINGVSGSTLTIGNNLTTNAIQIGTLTNSISIGATGCTTRIGATGSSTIIGGLLQMQTGTINGATGSTLAIGNNLTTEQIRIGSDASTTNIILKGNTYATGVVNVSGSITTDGSTTTAGLILTGNNNITLGGGVPTSTQLGYTKSTTSVNTSASTGYNNVTFNSPFNVFSDLDSSGYYGLFLGPGTWLINYNITFSTNSTTINWIKLADSRLSYNPTISSFGVSSLEAARKVSIFRSTSTALFGYALSNILVLTLNGFTIEQVTTNRFYNVCAYIQTDTASGTLIVAGKLTALRIA